MNPNRKVFSPNLGNRHSEATKERCRAAAQQQHRQGLSAGFPNWEGKTHREESKLRISQALMGNRNGNHRGDRQSYYRGIRMDSRWEVRTAEWLDDMGCYWRYSPRGFQLSDGRHYYPDFFVYDDEGCLDYLIEVKGYFREGNRLKFETFKREYPEIEIRLWEKPQLKELGIL